MAMTMQNPSIAKLALQEYHKAALAGPKPEQGVEAVILRHLIVMAEDELLAKQVLCCWASLAVIRIYRHVD